MADETIITVTNNQGSNRYAQVSRDFLISPVAVDFLRVIIDNNNQLLNLIKIRNSSSTGRTANRDISLSSYTNALNKTNLIVDIPLEPAMVIDGQTYFETDIEPYSEIYLIFYYKQQEIASIM
jgi:hypothetical protein